MSKAPNWWVKLGDFGVSKRVIHDGTSMHTSIETPYSAPEIRGFVSIDAEASCYTSAVDMWSLGCLVHWLLTQQLPLSICELLSYCTRDPVLPKKHLDMHQSSASAYDFIAKLLKPQPADRLTASDSLQHQWPKELPIIDPTESGLDLQSLGISLKQPSGLVKPVDSALNGELDSFASAAKPVHYGMSTHLDLERRPSSLYSGGSNEGVPSNSSADRRKREQHEERGKDVERRANVSAASRPWNFGDKSVEHKAPPLTNAPTVADARLVPNKLTAKPKKQRLADTFLRPEYHPKKSPEATRHSGLNAPIRLQLKPFYYPHMVTLTIVAAEGLLKAHVMSFPDPFAIVSINGRQIQRTSPCKQTLNPHWAHASDLYLYPNDTVLVEIFDQRGVEKKERGFLGGIRFKIKDLSQDDVDFGMSRMSQLIER